MDTTWDVHIHTTVKFTAHDHGSTTLPILFLLRWGPFGCGFRSIGERLLIGSVVRRDGVEVGDCMRRALDDDVGLRTMSADGRCRPMNDVGQLRNLVLRTRNST